MTYTLLAILLNLLLSGCFALSGLDDHGTDIAQLRVGQTRTTVEELLGPPVRERLDEEGGMRAIYTYQVVDQEVGARAGLLLVDIVSLGAFSLFCTVEGKCPEGSLETRELLLHFDQEGQLTRIESVLGEEFKAE